MSKEGEILGTEKYPADYKIFEVGHNVALKTAQKLQYFTVKGRNRVGPHEKQDTTNWLIAAAGTAYDAKDINDWLEPEDGCLYLLALGVDSDRDIGVLLRNPSGAPQLGTKGTDDIRTSPVKSPKDAPTITLKAWQTNYIPNFTISNPTEYTPIYVKLHVYGWKYQLEPLMEVPKTFSVVDFDKI